MTQFNRAAIHAFTIMFSLLAHVPILGMISSLQSEKTPIFIILLIVTMFCCMFVMIMILIHTLVKSEP